MVSPRVECEVAMTAFAATHPVANAFRVVSAMVDDLVWLDFCSYSASENRAVVLVRVTVSRDFLPLIAGRIDEAILEMPEGVVIDYLPVGES